jgi:F-type H+-transporting ATPase subunit epsilon
MADTFTFELVSPERLVLSEQAEQVLVPGTEGDFTVLPRHAPVLAVLRPGLLDLVREGGEARRYFVRGGFAEVNADNLTVLAQQAIDLEELDAARLAQEIQNAEEDVADAADDAQRDKVQDILDRLKAIQQTLQLS